MWPYGASKWDVLLSLVLGLSEWLAFTDGMFTSVWLGILACGPLYHEKSTRYVLIFLEWWSSVVLIWPSVKVWTLAWQPQPGKTSPEQLNLWHVDCSRTLPQIQGASGHQQAKEKQTSKIHHCSFSLSSFFSPGRQLLRLLVYLAGCSLARNLVCLTCLYETLSAHRCPDAFLSNTDGAPGEVIWGNACLVAVTGTQLAPIWVRKLMLNSWEPGSLWLLPGSHSFLWVWYRKSWINTLFSALQLFWLQLSCLNILGLGILIWKGRKFLSKCYVDWTSQ